MDKYIFNKIDTFDIRDILECGQVFRYSKQSDNDYIVYSIDKKCLIEQNSKKVIMQSSNMDYFKNYFDLDTDYENIISNIKDKPLVNRSLGYCKGVRILKQDHFETVISFIISANNNIKRIRKIIESICTNLGENMGDYYAFPTREQMANADENFFLSIGAGYRAKYLVNTIKKINEGFDLSSIRNMSTSKAREKLIQLSGVGPKVADCILLFSYGKMDVFPVDTWVRKIYKELTGRDNGSIDSISKDLVEMYGNYSGYAQQYLFYSKRIREQKT